MIIFVNSRYAIRICPIFFIILSSLSFLRIELPSVGFVDFPSFKSLNDQTSITTRNKNKTKIKYPLN